MTTATQDEIRLAGTVLDRAPHVCAFFNSADEHYEVLMPFIKEGISRGEKAFHIVDPELRALHFERLNGAGIDTASCESKKQLEVRRWQDAYLRDGRFDQNRMISLIEETLARGRDEGFPLTRLVANMEWAVEDRPGVDDLVEYETRLNYVLPKYKDPVICTYDCAKFGAGVAMDILRTHPMVILGGILQENPFYAPPDQFLEELRKR